jgi:predicted NAD/FAD-dependent oxidoreductase
MDNQQLKHTKVQFRTSKPVRNVDAPITCPSQFHCSVSDTKRLDWLCCNASKLGIRPDWLGHVVNKNKPWSAETVEYTDIRQRIDRLMKPNAGRQHLAH